MKNLPRYRQFFFKEFAKIQCAKRVRVALPYFMLTLLLLIIVVGTPHMRGYVIGDTQPISQKQISSSKAGFVAEADYVGEQEWSFTVAGNFSNQCITSDVAVEQLESDQEAVTVRLITYRPADETLCAQRVQEVKHEGTFVASRGASITLEIDERETKKSPTGLEPKNI